MFIETVGSETTLNEMMRKNNRRKPKSSVNVHSHVSIFTPETSTDSTKITMPSEAELRRKNKPKITTYLQAFNTYWER